MNRSGVRFPSPAPNSAPDRKTGAGDWFPKEPERATKGPARRECLRLLAVLVPAQLHAERCDGGHARGLQNCGLIGSLVCGASQSIELGLCLTWLTDRGVLTRATLQP